MKRRELIEAGLAAAAIGLLAPPLRAAGTAGALALITKAIPASGEKLPAIGLGTDAFK